MQEAAVILQRHFDDSQFFWSADGQALPAGADLKFLLTMGQEAMFAFLQAEQGGPMAEGSLQPPVEPDQEVWGSGVTYMRSRQAREAESEAADVYAAVYEAERPEIFFKAAGWRVQGHDQPVRIRDDSEWNVPEPELTLVINARGEIVGYTVGNDMSSRDIEGLNPLYLPQAKTYNGSCAVGPAITLCPAADLAGLQIQMSIKRGGTAVFEGETSTANMKRTFPELAAYLYRELSFPYGALLMTGTGIVPPDEFTLAQGDVISIQIGELLLRNPVAP